MDEDPVGAKQTAEVGPEAKLSGFQIETCEGGKAYHKMAAHGAQKVVLRCEDAKETGLLDMTECELIQVPDALYMLLMSSPPNKCDFSGNKLKKVPVKLCQKFSKITELRVARNQIRLVPDEIGELVDLKIFDLSDNQLESLPETFYQLPCLEEVSLESNQIKDIDVDKLMTMPALKKLNLVNNPLSDDVKTRLSQCARFSVQL